MGVTIDYHFQCDFCDEHLTEKQTYRRYEQMWEPTSPGGSDISWFWLNSNVVVCPKHWESLSNFIENHGKLDA